MESIVTIGIIIITTITSLIAFSNQKIFDAFIFKPSLVYRNGEWYRFFTCGLIHSDYAHLIFNMLALYFFGKNVEIIFTGLLGKAGLAVYLILYISALALSILPTYHKHKTSYNYGSLGASGAVSAVVFAGLALVPTEGIYMYYIPIPIPGFIFAPLYLLLSFGLQKRGRDNINHSAHIWGSIYGAAFVIILSISIGYPIFNNFVEQVRAYMIENHWIR